MSLTQNNVLILNSLWQAIGTSSVKKSFIAMCSSNDGENMAAKALNIEYKKNPDNTYDFDTVEAIVPLSWDEWVLLPIREFDSYVRTPHSLIRSPSVLVALNYNKMPMKDIKPTRKNIYDKYGGKCAYTGKKLGKNSFSVDHLVPISRWAELKKTGNVNGWLNVVPADKEINYRKGNRLNEEIGLELLIKPSEPRPVPVSQLIREIRNRDWNIFLNK